jgi:hypothetical protein
MKKISNRKNHTPGTEKPRALDSGDLRRAHGGDKELIPIELKHVGIFN